MNETLLFIGLLSLAIAIFYAMILWLNREKPEEDVGQTNCPKCGSEMEHCSIHDGYCCDECGYSQNPRYQYHEE